MGDSIKVSIDKLNNENYYNWKYKVQLLLMKEGLWKVINDQAPSPMTDDWRNRDDKARATIGLLVEDNQLIHVREVTTAKEAWDSLKGYHEKTTLSTKVFLLKSAVNQKLDDGGDMEEHVSTILDKFNKYAAVGEPLTDSLQIAIMLGSLPSSYDTLVTALESRSEKELTLALVKGKLIDEHKRRLGAKGEVHRQLALKSFKKDNVRTCYFCKKPGHLRDACIKYKSWRAKKEYAGKAESNDTDDEIEGYRSFIKELKAKKERAGKAESNDTDDEAEYRCFIVCESGHESEHIWCIDSGATSYMTPNRKFLEKFTELNDVVKLANGKTTYVKGIGSGIVNCIGKNGQITPVKFENVLYVPDLDGNLLSVKKLLEKGYKVNFERQQCAITKAGELVAQGDMHDGLFRLKQCHMANLVQPAHTDKCQHTWHRKLGHRDPSAIKLLEHKGLANGIKVVDCGIRASCTACVEGKMSRKPFPKKSATRTSAILDLLHTDLCGPMRTATPSGKKYILTIIDDFSRYTVIYLLKNKSDTIDAIKGYVEMVKTKFKSRPKVIRSDRGREYITSQLKGYLDKNGTKTQFAAPYSPQQNGVAERKNRYLVEMARTMLLDAGMGKTYWGEAVHTAIYLQNRLPSRTTGKTPYELWESHLPDLSQTHIFGCKAFVHIPKQFRGKLESKAELLTFVGYEEGSKAYRFLDTNTAKIKVSRDANFIDEHLFNSGVTLNLRTEQFSNEKFDNAPIKTEKEDINDNLPEMVDRHEDELEDPVRSINENTGQLLRTSQRKKKQPDRYGETVKLLSDNTEPRTAKEALSGPDGDQWKKAMDDEMESLRANNTWELVDLPDDRKAVGSRWVFKTKQENSGSIKYKARLVARGFSQKYGEDYYEIFAPVVRHPTIRILLTLAKRKKYHMRQFDAKTAFLNGKLKETIYMSQPDYYVQQEKADKVCKLNKSIYGLKQAAKAWYDELKRVLEKKYFTQSKVDPCLYIMHGDGRVFLIVYVDDILLTGNSQVMMDQAEQVLTQSFRIVALGEPKTYLGFSITRDENGTFYIDQRSHIKRLIKETNMEDAKTSNVSIDLGYEKVIDDDHCFEDKQKYQSLIGKLLYLGVHARPDILASVCILSQRNSKPRQYDWNEAKRIIRYLKGTVNLQLKLGTDETAYDGLAVYSDANWAQSPLDRKSVSGYIIQLYGSTIAWGCKKQTCVALSTTEAEYVALTEACMEMRWIQRLLANLDEDLKNHTQVFEDNQSCLNLLNNSKLSNRMRHIDTKYHFVKDVYEKEEATFHYCATEEMKADIMTKPLGRFKLIKLREAIGLRDWTEQTKELYFIFIFFVFFMNFMFQLFLPLNHKSLF